MPYVVPTGLLEQAELGPDWAGWLDGLPLLVDEVVRDWGLTYDGPPRHGFASLVAPVRTPTHGPAMLKLTFSGDEESLHEAVALQHWNGRGTVRLLRADPHRRALLLERLHTEDLTSVDVEEACDVVAGFYARLHVPALPQLRPVASYVERWIDDLATLPRNAPIPRRFVEQAASLGRELVADGGDRMVHGDLHYENVLAGDREPWLIIDPKPMAGDPHYEPAPLLWNRWHDLGGGGTRREAVRSRLFTVVDAAGMDEARARAWVVVRAVLNASWSVQDAQGAGRGLREAERQWITRCITIAKAVQD